MQSYLDGSYLGDSDVQLEAPPPAAMLVHQDHALAGQDDEMIALPGGIVLPKKTLLILAAVAAGLILYMTIRNKDQ